MLTLMHFADPAKLERRLNRRELWASLWLTRALGFLIPASDAPQWRAWLGQCLDRIACFVMQAIVIRASLSPEFQTGSARKGRASAIRRAAPFRPQQHTSLRAVIGAGLRKALRADALQGRARKILDALRNRDALIAKLARRLRKGLSRLGAAEARADLGLPLHCPAGGPPLQAKLGEDLRVTVAPP